MASKKSAFNLQTCARPNVLKLQPYRCARDDYEDDGRNILLDANENAYGPGIDLSTRISTNGLSNGISNVNGHDHSADYEINIEGLNRYPDPHQVELKKLICSLRDPASPSSNKQPLSPSNLFVGVGSDEAIDTLMRVFCAPGQSSILVCPPTYGMYTVSAHVNDLSIISVPLLTPSFEPDVPAINTTLSSNSTIKLLYLCSPGNPTGKLISQAVVEEILSHPTWNGVVIVDEAYVDFAAPPWPSTTPSLAPLVPRYENLVALGTLSKGHGLAGLRLGYAITAPPIARLMNALKAPYNISSLTSQLATRALQPPSLARARKHIDALLVQRARLVEGLPQIPGLGAIKGGLDANFVLVEVMDRLEDGVGKARPSNPFALQVYEKLAGSRGVVVRFRGKEYGCEGCLRVTVGTEKEVSIFLREVKDVLEDVMGKRGRDDEGVEVEKGGDEERREAEESQVIA